MWHRNVSVLLCYAIKFVYVALVHFDNYFLITEWILEGVSALPFEKQVGVINEVSFIDSCNRLQSFYECLFSDIRLLVGHLNVDNFFLLFYLRQFTILLVCEWVLLAIH
jgi:hypothetical protein